MARLPDRVETDRLVVRMWRPEDAEALHALVTRNVEHLRPFMDWIAFEPLTVEDRGNLIDGWVENWNDSGDATMGIHLDGQPIGATGLHKRSGPSSIEIGYWIDADHQGKGYATEVTRGLTNLAFTLPEIERVELRIDDANVASIAVARKLGFVYELSEPREVKSPGQSGINQCWAATRETWPA